jgi:hypothetical protein
MKVGESPARVPHILLYGDPGSWKTALVQTLGDGLQILDLESGYHVGKHVDDQFKKDRLAVDIISCVDPDPTKALAFQNAKSHIISVANGVTRKKYGFKAFCIDSLTALTDSAVRSVLANSGRLGLNPEIQHWGLAFNELENVLTICRSLPIPFILIAHTMNVENEYGQTKKEIAIQGQKLPGRITRYFGEIWYISVRPGAQDKIVAAIKTKSTSQYLARSHSGLPDDLSAKDGLPAIFNKMGYDWPRKEEDVK